MPKVHAAPEPNPVLLVGSDAARPQDLTQDPDPKVMAEDNVVVLPEPEPEVEENPALEFAENGDLVLGGVRVGRIFHVAAGTSALVPFGTPPWALQIMDTDEFDAVDARFGSQERAKQRAQELLAGKDGLRPKPGRRRR